MFSQHSFLIFVTADTLTGVRWHLPGIFQTPDSHSCHSLWENIYGHTHRAAFQLTTDGTHGYNGEDSSCHLATLQPLERIAQRLQTSPRLAEMWVWVTTGSSYRGFLADKPTRGC